MTRSTRELFGDFTRAVSQLKLLGDEISLEEAEGLLFQLEELVRRSEHAVELAHDRNPLTTKDLGVLERAGVIKCVTDDGDQRSYALTGAGKSVLKTRNGSSR